MFYVEDLRSWVSSQPVFFLYRPKRRWDDTGGEGKFVSIISQSVMFDAIDISDLYHSLLL